MGVLDLDLMLGSSTVTQPVGQSNDLLGDMMDLFGNNTSPST